MVIVACCAKNALDALEFAEAPSNGKERWSAYLDHACRRSGSYPEASGISDLRGRAAEGKLAVKVRQQISSS
jgi:hypothetical protein